MSESPDVVRARRRYYRWALSLFGGYAIFGVVVLAVLLVSITDANAGYPALFFGALFMASAMPVCALCAVFAAVSLAKREPHRLAVGGVLVVSGLLAVWLAAPAFAVFKGLAQIFLK